jgi:hypothetical protein
VTPPADPPGRFDPIGDLLGRIRAEFAGDDRGAVADYIPELSTADPDAFGLALVGVAGSRYEAGESTVPFTIQSVSKPSTPSRWPTPAPRRCSPGWEWSPAARGSTPSVSSPARGVPTTR